MSCAAVAAAAGFLPSNPSATALSLDDWLEQSLRSQNQLVQVLPVPRPLEASLDEGQAAETEPATSHGMPPQRFKNHCQDGTPRLLHSRNRALGRGLCQDS